MPKISAQARPANLAQTLRRLLSYMGHAKFSLLAVGPTGVYHPTNTTITHTGSLIVTATDTHKFHGISETTSRLLAYMQTIFQFVSRISCSYGKDSTTHILGKVLTVCRNSNRGW